MASATTRRSRFASFEFIFGVLITAVICLAVLFSDVLFPGGADKLDLMARLTEPFVNAAHPLGTDPLGRDVLARVVAGGKISLLVGISSVAGAVVIGVLVGLIAGYYRGLWDMLVMRFADIQLATPFILLPLTIFATIGSRLTISFILPLYSHTV